MSKEAKLTAAAALQEIFLDSGSEQSASDLDDSDTDIDNYNLVGAQASGLRRRSRSRSSLSTSSDEEELDAGLDTSRVGNRGVKPARGWGPSNANDGWIEPEK